MGLLNEFLVILLASALTTLPKAARTGINHGSNNRISPYLGQVATRTVLPSTFDTTLFFANNRRAHFARDGITSLQIIVPNFYATPTGERAPGAASTVTASVEYPIGTRNQVKFSGMAAGTVPSGSYLISDPLRISIPKGAMFYHWGWVHNRAGFLYAGYDDNQPGVFLSEGYEWAATDPGDKTISGTIINLSPTNTNVFGCCGIIAQTKVGSAYLIGDSRWREGRQWNEW
jgi:hypothetical protein